MIKGFKKFCLCLLAAGAAGGILAGCNSPANRVLSSRQEYAEQMQAAVSTPFGAYPETVVYTLGKMISTNNSNMPAGDTYEDNAYTRYIKEVINVQNRDVFEEADKQYDTNVSMAIAMNELPDIMRSVIKCVHFTFSAVVYTFPENVIILPELFYFFFSFYELHIR